MVTLTEMLRKAEVEYNRHGYKTSITDKAIDIVNNGNLSLKDKIQTINNLAKLAQGYDRQCFPLVYEALYASIDSIEELIDIKKDKKC